MKDLKGLHWEPPRRAPGPAAHPPGWRLPALAAALFLTFHVLLAFGFTPFFPPLATLLLGLLYWRIGPLAALLVAGSLAIGTVVLDVALDLGGVAQRLYSGPHYMLSDYDYAHDHPAYRRNKRLEMEVAHGNLAGGKQSAVAAEPHRTRFQTDDFGFRNDGDYAGQRLVLVGDSFIAGVDNSQEETLAAQLHADYGVDAYAAAHPGGVSEYRKYVEGLRARIGNDFKVLLFLFEGDDFPTADGRFGAEAGVADVAVPRGIDRYFRLFSDSLVYRYSAALVAPPAAAAVRVATDRLGAHPIAYNEPYVAAATAADYSPPAGWEEAIAAIGDNLQRIYFIPTKYRVYHPLADLLAAPLPDARWGYLKGACERRGWRCTNLTAALREEAGRLLENGSDQLLYWRDDTHWNDDGIAVAAQVVIGDLAER